MQSNVARDIALMMVKGFTEQHAKAIIMQSPRYNVPNNLYYVGAQHEIHISKPLHTVPTARQYRLAYILLANI